jgi:hypothetical protein
MKQYGNIDFLGSGTILGLKELVLSPQLLGSTTEGRLYYNSSDKLFYGRTDIAEVVLSGHAQNTDTGTTQTSFIINSLGRKLTFTASTQGSDITIHGEKVVITDQIQTLQNKTLETPVILDLSRAQHDHSSASKGGSLNYSSLTNRPVIHDQNTDTGTTSGTFDILSSGSGVRLEVSNGSMSLKNLLDTSYADLSVQNIVINGDLTVNGTHTTVNSVNLEVSDKNISVNKGGTTAGALGAGLSVLGDLDNPVASLVYDSSTTSKFKVGTPSSEIEIADISSPQVISYKTIDNTNTINAGAVNTGVLPSSVFPTNILKTTTSQTISGAKTFSLPSGSQPFIIDTPYASGATVSQLSADLLDGKHAPVGEIVGTSDSQSLTNKTINGSLNSISNINLATAVTGVLPIVNGGTGSATRNFVDRTSNETIAGIKTFSNQIILTSLTNQLSVVSGSIVANLSWTPTDNRSITLPDSSGTIALTTDIPTGISDTTSQLFNIDKNSSVATITNSGITVGSDSIKPSIRFNGAVWQVSDDGIVYKKISDTHVQNTDLGTTQASFTINSAGINNLVIDTSSLTNPIHLDAEKIVTVDAQQTLLNKTISGASNTITFIGDSSLSTNVLLRSSSQAVTGLKTFDRPSGTPPFGIQTVYADGATVTNLSADLLDGKHAPTGDIVGTSDAQVLYNKTLSNPILPSSLIFQGITHSLSVNFIEPSLSRSITLSDPGANDTLAYLGAQQTLSSKTLIQPKINTSLVLTDPNGDITVTWDSTTSRSIIIPDSDGTISLIDAVQTLTNKSIISSSNHISASIIDTGSLDNSRLSASALEAVSLRHTNNTDTGTTQSTFKINSTGSNLILSANGLSGSRTFTFPDITDQVVTLLAPQVLTNKTIDGSLNTLYNVNLTTSVTGVLPISNGGTGSSTQNFVDLTNSQTIGGVKTFMDLPIGPNITPTLDLHLVTKKYVDQSVPVIHSQNTDTGTTNATFTVASSSSNGQVILQGGQSSGNSDLIINNAGLQSDLTISASSLKTTVEDQHIQGTDHGTTRNDFILDSDGLTPIKLKNNLGILQIRDSVDTSYVKVETKELYAQDRVSIGGISGLNELNLPKNAVVGFRNSNNSGDIAVLKCDSDNTTTILYEGGSGLNIIDQATKSSVLFRVSGTGNTIALGTLSAGNPSINGSTILQGGLASGAHSFTISNSGLITDYTVTAVDIKNSLIASHIHNTDTGTSSGTFTINSNLTLDSVGLTASRVYTFPDSNGIVITDNGSQELTNKKITFPKVNSNTMMQSTSIQLDDAVYKKHVQGTDVGTDSQIFTINTSGDAANYVMLSFENGVNDRSIRLNKATKKIEIQKSDGTYIDIDTIVSQNVSVGKYVFPVSTPQTSWIINHPLNTSNLTITLWDDNNKVILGEITQQTDTLVVVEFAIAQAGRAVLIG